MRHATRFILLLTVPIMFFGCAQQGPVTHAQAYVALKRAYTNGSNTAISSLLSQNSINHIEKVTLAISRLNKSAKQHMAEKLGIQPERLDNLTPQDYLSLYMQLNKNYAKDIVAAALEYDPVSVSEAQNHARYTMPNNITLYFIREDPYWKFDLERTVW